VAPACRLEGTIHQRTLRNEDAAATLDAIAEEAVSRWLLCWLPLMRGGAEPGIIQGWRHEAAKEPDALDRANLGGLTLVFATLGRCRPAWDKGLKGWNVQTSPFLDQFRAEGRAEGHLEALRETLLRQGRKKFGKGPTRKQQAQLTALTDRATLERLSERLLDVSTWAELLAEL
jgi:hypothetical protein